MTRSALAALRPGAPVLVVLEHGAPVRAVYHSHEIEGRGRSARTYVRVRLLPRGQPVRVHAARVRRVGT